MSHGLVWRVSDDYRVSLIARLRRIASESSDTFTQQQIKDLIAEINTPPVEGR